MQKNCFKAIVFGIFAVCAGAAVENVKGQTLQVITRSTPWRYNTNGTELGTTWRALGYVDTVAGWQGPGTILFGFEGEPQQYFDNYGLSFNTDFGNPQPYGTGGAFRTNFYFRAHFTLPNYSSQVLSNITLQTTNWIDDGAIVYLNGTELFRFNMPADPVYASTFASGTLTEPIQHVTNNTSSVLMSGDNVIAVELHQAGTGSSDEVFGMVMNAILPVGPVITQQPLSQTNVLGATNVILRVVATGTPPLSYQWYSNSVRVVGANSSSFTVYTGKTNVADWYVVVSNFVNTATSDTAHVAIVRDVFSPRILSAISGPPPASLASNQVLVTFDERLNTTAGNPASATTISNYVITILGLTNKLTITAAQASINNFNQTFVKLTCMETLTFPNGYVLTVNRIADTNGNVIIANSSIGITLNVSNRLMEVNNLWYWEGENGDDLGTAWKEFAYVVPPTWGGPASGYLYFDPVSGGRPTFDCWPTDDPSTYGGFLKWTYYHRAHFNYPSNYPSAGTVHFNHFIDDGAIFYLNGTEIFRFNMPDGPVSAADYALTGIVNASCTTTDVFVNNLLPGDNVLAVEVHQTLRDDTGQDVIMGVEMTLTQATADVPQIQMSRSDTNLVLSWPKSLVGTKKWGLDYTTNSLGTNATWFPLTTPNPYTTPVAPNIPRRFFRLTLK